MSDRSHKNGAAGSHNDPERQRLLDEEAVISDDDSSPGTTIFTAPEHSMTNHYKRPSFVSGSTPTVLPDNMTTSTVLPSEEERAQLIEEERTLLEENNLMPPRSAKRGSSRSGSKRGPKLSTGHPKGIPDEEQGHLGSPTETTSLLSGRDSPTSQEIDQKFEDAVLRGWIKTSWQIETRVLIRRSAPLVVTFLLQYSLTVASIFAVGHIGEKELGAVSLAHMTANITGYSVYHGLTTSLDTLCSQAYGKGKKHLVGIHLQRMLCFLCVVTVPIGIVWYNGAVILQALVPEKETAAMAGQYLRIILLGAPGYAAFESAKHFVQSQGLFDANLYVLLVCAPLNAFLNWLFVWHLGWGFIGAPIAVAIVDNLLPFGLFLYVYFVKGRECWGGWSRAALNNWGPMVMLALPGLIMVVAEFFAFEVLTLAASYISGTHLAAQSVLSTMAALLFQLPFPMSICASSRIANLIGATLPDAAKVAAAVAVSGALFSGVLNLTVLFALRNLVPKLFTSDEGVAAVVSATLPIMICFQVLDSLGTMCNGILRGLGRQGFGGYVNLFAYYVIALPISFSVGFGLKWELVGLWLGPAIAMFLIFIIEGIFIFKTDWSKCVADAERRNELG